MARQARRDSRPHVRPFGAGSSARVAARRGAAPGSTRAWKAARPVPTPSAPETKATYRLLLLRGLAPDEAANLTAFLCGIQVGSQPWKLGEVNRLLFLRELRQGGRFGSDDGAEAPAA
jgi:hypothetical protein